VIAEELGPPRWRGRRHRLEVWYATFTDPATDDGYWLHHEVVAPTVGDPYAHGWAAAFPAGGPPRVERFGPVAVGPAGEEWFRAGDVVVGPGVLWGRAGDIEWDLRFEDRSPPLFTFPAWAWQREVLPAAQVVPFPAARFDGRFGEVDLHGARGALARIYGHGNAERWGWLHADLGDGDVVEVVAAAPRRRGPVALPPLPMVQLRVGGRDWPLRPLLAAGLGRARLGLPRWSATLRSRRHRLTVKVLVPPEASVSLAYTDPDGATATCTNSERASAQVTLEAYDGGWRVERHWALDGTAHAEVGTRP
jgi:hypothetical protein